MLGRGSAGSVRVPRMANILWVGNAFGLGEDRDPISGCNHGTGRFVIPGDIRKREEPFV